MTALIFSFIIFLFILLGGFLAIKLKDKIHYIISFTAGILLAVVFFEIIPEIFNISIEKNIDIIKPLIALIVGFMFIHILEKVAVLHHHHEEEYAEHKHPLVGMASALGLAFHSFLDGVGIGLGFQVDYRVGLLIALAILAHGFSDGLNTASLMMINKNTMKRTISFLLMDAVAPILGVLATLIFIIPESFLVLYLGFFAGFILYISASDLLPEAHSQHSSYKLIGLTTAGIIFIFIVTRLI
jgi:ZIP family zinc transporter